MASTAGRMRRCAWGGRRPGQRHGCGGRAQPACRCAGQYVRPHGLALPWTRRAQVRPRLRKSQQGPSSLGSGSRTGVGAWGHFGLFMCLGVFHWRMEVSQQCHWKGQGQSGRPLGRLSPGETQEALETQGSRTAQPRGPAVTAALLPPPPPRFPRAEVEPRSGPASLLGLRALRGGRLAPVPRPRPLPSPQNLDLTGDF